MLGRLSWQATCYPVSLPLLHHVFCILFSTSNCHLTPIMAQLLSYTMRLARISITTDLSIGVLASWTVYLPEKGHLPSSAWQVPRESSSPEIQNKSRRSWQQNSQTLAMGPCGISYGTLFLEMASLVWMASFGTTAAVWSDPCSPRTDCAIWPSLMLAPTNLSQRFPLQEPPLTWKICSTAGRWTQRLSFCLERMRAV